MASLSNGIDLLLEPWMGKRLSHLGGAADHSAIRGATCIVYGVFFFVWCVIWGRFSDGDFSAVLTASATVQCLGFFVLSVNVHGTKSVSGLSSKTLLMFVLHLSSRLTSTSLKNGYLPSDKSGDFMYQFMDACSLVLACRLLYCIHKVYRSTYQEEHDTFHVFPIVCMSLVVGLSTHGRFNKDPFFDVIWATSTNLEAFVLVPQLWMLASVGGKVESVTAHYVAAVVLSGVLSCTFWWWTFDQVVRRGEPVAGYLIILIHALKLLFSADFMYFYVHAWISGLPVVLPERELVNI